MPYLQEFVSGEVNGGVQMKINRGIFREYDIRGVFEEDIKGDFPYLLGKAFGSYLVSLGRRSVCVGGDNRQTTPGIKEKIVKGISETGCEVADMGIIPTPVLYFAVHKHGKDAGLMVTASHNPPEYNGFKMVVGERSLYGEEIQKIADYVETENFHAGKGKICRQEVVDEYVSFLAGKFRFTKKFRIGVDTGNGTLGPTLMKVLSALAIEVSALYVDSDPSFPNHLPDPLVEENLADLRREVVGQNLDAGFAYDGDGDRIGVIDDRGAVLWGDRLMILYAREVLKSIPGAPVIFDVKCTRALEEEIEKAGGRPVMWKTGHSLIEDKLHKEKAPLAGELSGHIYFADEYYGYDDAVYASLRLLRIMDNSEGRLSGLLSGIREYSSTPEIRIEIPDAKKFAAVDRLKEIYARNYDISDIDGVKVFFPGGWALARASNTQPAVVVRVEADNGETLEKIKQVFLASIEEVVEKA